MKCPYCNHDNIHVEKQGFGFGKALIGGVFLGPLGLFCGAINKNKLKCTCLNCGRTFNVDEGIQGEIKTSINNTTDMNEEDILYNQALALIQKTNKVSTSYLQRALRIGYNKAGDIINKLEKNNVITPADELGRRRVLCGCLFHK